MSASSASSLPSTSPSTAPSSRFLTQPVSPSPRYAKLAADMQWLARRTQTAGLHVHVGLRSPAKAMEANVSVRALSTRSAAAAASNSAGISRPDDTSRSAARKVLDSDSSARPSRSRRGR